jgi:hypothetical protein
VAIIIDGDRLLSMSIDPESPPAACSQRDVRLLLGNARDVVLVGDASEEQIRARLVTAREQDDGLELALFTLDAELSEGTRTDAATALEELFACDEVRAFVQNVLLSRPAPKSADLRGALRLAHRARAGKVEALLLCVGSLQPKVEEVWRAWEALPATLFEGEHHLTDARAAFVRAGLFSALVRDDQRAFLQSAASREVGAIEGYETMLLTLSAASSRESRARMTFRYVQVRQDSEPGRTLEARDEPRKRVGKRIRHR